MKMQIEEGSDRAFVLPEGASAPIFLTEEQRAVVERLRDSVASLGLDAVAGSGKSFSLRIAAAELPPRERTLACAFNKHNADTLTEVMPRFVDCRTFNGLGHRAWQTFLRKRVRLDAGKIGKLTTEYIKGQNDSRLREHWPAIRQLADLMKTYGYAPRPILELGAKKSYISETDLEELAFQRGIDAYEKVYPAACMILESSCRAALGGTIDFSDQIYMSVLWRVRYEKYDNVLVDEAQDLNPLNHIQIKRSLKKETGRLIVVGDPRQSIYGFRGAVPKGMEALMEWASAERLGLTVCFRCAKNIVLKAQDLVPHIQYAEDAAEGKVEKLREWDSSLFRPGDAVLCRNNAPLIAAAFYLIRNRISVRVLGRDIGKGLVAILKKIDPSLSMPMDIFAIQLEGWEAQQVALASARQDDHMIDSIHDKAETIREVAAAVVAPTVAEVVTEIEDLFDRTSGAVTLSTVHKAKGMEWPRVFILDTHLIPPQWLRQKVEVSGDDTMLEQEHNLDYVARTRAKEELYYINSQDRDRAPKEKPSDRAGLERVLGEPPTKGGREAEESMVIDLFPESSS